MQSNLITTAIKEIYFWVSEGCSVRTSPRPLISCCKHTFVFKICLATRNETNLKLESRLTRRNHNWFERIIGIMICFHWQVRLLLRTALVVIYKFNYRKRESAPSSVCNSFRFVQFIRRAILFSIYSKFYCCHRHRYSNRNDGNKDKTDASLWEHIVNFLVFNVNTSVI